MVNKRGKHKSVDKELRPSIAWLESLSIVKRVIINRCEAARHSYKPGTLRFKHATNGGAKLNAYGGRGVVDIFVKTDNVEDLIKNLNRRVE